MREQMGSKAAQERLDEVISSTFPDLPEAFEWGYGFYQGDAHSWDRGCKYGWWLVIPEHYDSCYAEMRKVQKAVEALDFVSGCSGRIRARGSRRTTVSRDW